ncbi:type II 3-dehydroquinate dehydratase [Algibacillus agarilyticus]|uniref:type II 3-dehydroquinate dehydratase n=1 Tax=Algibacillus agarilyticus TaxID=2234133 RepID=UPI000DCF64D6|nr:type II 3-dehydroquinate dehydratase [Algibacillus agarilyticus]
MSAFKQVLLLNGPNLNMLGKREPAVYGSKTLNDIELQLSQEAKALDIELSCFQSNSEAEIINRIHASFETIDFIIINPAAFTHQSVALRDAILAVNIPFIEVHISNVHAREAFRHHSYFSDIAQGVICGLGIAGYSYALQSASNYLNN